MTEKEMLEEAKRRYPVGIKYKCACNTKEHKVNGKQEFKIINSLTIYGNPGDGCLMFERKWAEIIEKIPNISPLQFTFGKFIQ